MMRLGYPVHMVATVRDLYTDTSIVETPLGRTSPIPNMGRGTMKGDELSLAMFIMMIEPLIRWLIAGDRSYQFGTSSQRVGPLAFVDDVVVLAAHTNASQSKRAMSQRVLSGRD